MMRILRAALLLTATALWSQAGTFSTDFNTGDLPPGTHTNANTAGGAYLELAGGVGDSGCLKLTKNINSQNGSFILDDFDAGMPVYGFEANFKLRLGGGSSTPADGMAFCVAPALDFSDTSIWGETGAGSWLRFCWPFYTGSGQTPPDPAIKVRVGDGVVAWKGYTVAGITTTGDYTTWWADVHIRLNPDGSLTLDYKGENVFTNFFVPGYQDFVNAGSPVRFGFGARTGGLNANQWIDDLEITTFTTPMVGISQQPFDQTAQEGDTVSFDVRVANVNGVTYQWYSNNVAIAGATSQTLTLANVPASASGSQYKVTATGPNNAVTSTEVTLTVIDLAPPTPPEMAFNFNDGLQPAAVTLTGTAYVDLFGGIGDSGCVKLTYPEGVSAMLVTDPNATSPLYGFTARFKLLVGGGTVPPADGFAFAFGADIPDAPTGDFEAGAGLGSGLRVTFDIYNNDGIFGFPQNEGGQPAPSIDVRYGGQVLGTVHLPISFMESGLNELSLPAYTDVIIQLNDDATLSVVYHGALVFDRLPIPGFGSMGASGNSFGARFALAARTGGLNDNIWVDDFELTTVTTPGEVRITTQPVSQTILINHAMTNTVAVNDTAGVTYQWYRDGGALSGATESSYVVPAVALADSGAVFTVEVTKSGVTVPSDPATLTVCNLTAPSSPNLTFNFDDGSVPPNTAVYSGAGGGYITTYGGVGDSGCLHITDNVNSQSGAFVINSLHSGAEISALAVSWDLRMGEGSGNPADGHSFNFANNLPDSVSGGENGVGNNLRVCWDIYGAWTDASPAPAVNIRYKGAIIGSALYNKPDIQTGTEYRRVLLRVDADGKLYMSFGERVLFNGLQLPNYTYIGSGRFGFYGRTGGQNVNQWFDNIQIEATKSSGPLAITTQPSDTVVISGKTATFTVGVNDPTGVTYQWYKNDAVIPGATGMSYTTPAATLGDSGALFKVTATGPSGTATSDNAVLTVVPAITVDNPIVTYDFNDYAQPPDTVINLTGAGSGGYISIGGIGDSGCLHLTDASNDAHAAFIMPDFNSNAPIKAITAYFAVRVAEGSGRPADGFSFVWAPSNNIPSGAVFGQNGIGGWLVVGFDTYDNSGEAPSFNVWYRDTQVASKLVPYSALYTGDLSTDPLQQYADVFIRVSEDGILDLHYKGSVVFNALPLPGYVPLAGGQFAIGAQTGGENETHWFDNITIATTPGYIGIPLDYTRTETGLRFTWGSDLFKLQSTMSLNPVNWTDVPTGGSSPVTVPIGTGAEYFRLAPKE